MRRALLLATLCSCAVTPRSQQQERVQSLMPAKAEARAVTQQTSVVLRVRALTADDYRSQVLHPEDTIASQFLALNEYTEPTLGVRLELVDVKPWPHRTGQELSESLAALESIDTGDVDLVVGYVGGLTIVELTLDKLGMARLGGRHLVLRAVDDRAEAAAFKAAFTALDLEEREALSRARRRHKEATLLLHEWAHTLGGPHDGFESGCLFPHYTPQQVGFHPKTLEVLSKLVEVQYQRPPTARAAARMLEALALAPPGHFLEADLEPWTTLLEKLSKAKSAAPLQSASTGNLERARTLARSGQLAAAKAELEPLLVKADPLVLELACVIDLQLDAATAVPSCERAAQKEEPDAVLRLATAQLAAKTPVPARENLLKAHRLATDTTTKATWLHLAQLSQGALCLGLVERAATRAAPSDEATTLLDWASSTRRWMGLRGDVQGSPCEAVFLETFQTGEAALREKRFAVATQASAKLRALSPKSSGARALDCEQALLTGQVPYAQRLCEAALHDDPEQALAHYLLSLIAGAFGNPKQAVLHLSKVVELTPTFRDAWVRLGAAHRKAKNTAAVEALDAKYRARFAQPLP